MRIGVPKEIKTHEYRVGLVPSSVRELVHHGHGVTVETGAGAGIGCEDWTYEASGATIVETAQAVWAAADLVVKVKEPQPSEYGFLRQDLTLFTYLHLAADAPQAAAIMESGATAIGYETVTDPRGHLPLLAPMSEVAGRMAAQVAAHCLEKEQGGVGLLMGGVPGVAPARVAVIGGGMVGSNAARVAMGMEANVTVIDKSPDCLYEIDLRYGPAMRTVFSTVDAIEAQVENADVVIGSVLVPGAAAPKLVTREMVKRMRPGSVIVDVAIDQGGCCETSHPTTHADPTYIEEGVVHYCVTNMPGAVARTSAFALNNATLPFVLALAEKGCKVALRSDPHLRAGLNVCGGKITHGAVAEALGKAYCSPDKALGRK